MQALVPDRAALSCAFVCGRRRVLAALPPGFAREQALDALLHKILQKLRLIDAENLLRGGQHHGTSDFGQLSPIGPH